MRRLTPPGSAVVRPNDGPTCPDCGATLRQVEETVGDTGRVKTSYSVCNDCGRRVEHGA